MSQYHKRITSYYRLFFNCSLFSLAAFLFWASVEAEEKKVSRLWSEDPCDEVCHGYWREPFFLGQRLDSQELEVEFSESTIDTAQKRLFGHKAQISGKEFSLTSETVSIDLHHKEELTLAGDIVLSTKMITLFSETMAFDPQKKQGRATEVEFIIYPWKIHGQAKRAFFDKKDFSLEEVSYTQCPVKNAEWQIEAKNIFWQESLQQLKISDPSLSLFNQPFTLLPSIVVKEDKATNTIATLPYIKFATDRGLRFNFPKLFNHTKASTKINPEISTKYGLSSTVEYNKEQQKILGLVELFSLKKTWDKYLGIKNSVVYENDKVYFDYALNFVSNDTAVYRYPEIIPNLNKQVMVNFLSVKKKLDQGYLKLYGESLYQFEQKKIRDENVIETPVKLLHFYQSKQVNLWQTLSFIKQKKGESFHRYKLKSQLLSSLPGFFNFNTILDSGHCSLMKISHRLPLVEQNLFSQGKFFVDLDWLYSYREPTLHTVETRFLPLSFESFFENSWHNGDDWASSYAHLNARLDLEPWPDYLLELTASLSLSSQEFFDQHWSYFSPFKSEQDRLSALGVRLSGPHDFSASAIISQDLSELVTVEVQKRFETKDYQGYLGYYLHNYFPTRKAIEPTKQVRQLHLGAHTTTSEAWEYFFHSSIDLNPFKLQHLDLGVANNRCCWKNSFGIKLSQEYSPEEQMLKMRYGLSFQVEIATLGFLKMGSASGKKRAGLAEKPWKDFAYSNAYGY